MSLRFRCGLDETLANRACARLTGRRDAECCKEHQSWHMIKKENGVRVLVNFKRVRVSLFQHLCTRSEEKN